MSGTLVVALLTPPEWTPRGTAPDAWRAALAEDAVDLVAGLVGVEAAIAVPAGDLDLAAAVGWPTTRVYELSPPTGAMDASDGFAPDRITEVLDRAAGAGYQRAAVLCSDAPDLPALLVGKLLRPLSSRAVALAPALGGGLVGVAARLPAPAWLGGALTGGRAENPRQVAVTPAWHRLRTADDLRRLDPGLEGWEATRVLLG